jgi:hypothetical protein
MSTSTLDPVVGLLAKVRRRVVISEIVRTCALMTLAAGAAVFLLLLADAALDLSDATRRWLRWAPALAILPALLLWRLGGRTGSRRLASLVDGTMRTDGLVATYLAPNTSGTVADAFRARALEAIRGVEARQVVPYQVGALWIASLAAWVLVSGVLAAGGGPARATERWWSTPAVADRGAAGEAPAVAAPATVTPTLGAVSYTILPPAYSGIEATEGDALTPIAALPGSVIEVRGAGRTSPADLSATAVGGEPIPTRVTTGGWAVDWTVGPDDRGLAMALARPAGLLEQKVLPLRLLRDRAPEVALTEPSADLVLATASGRITIGATATDDYGVQDLTLHWVLSRGSGESFDFSEGQWLWQSVERTNRGATGVFTLSLDTLGLEAGDVIHVRAMTTDGNDVTGPGIGVSETRQIRISRSDDLSDVTTIIGFPIDREREPLLSQRMIILLTEELRDNSSGLDAAELRSASADIADEQARLRGRIGEQIFSRATGAMQDPEAHLDFEEGEPQVFLEELEQAAAQGPVIDPETGIASIANVDIPAHEHDSDPIVAINRGLLTVYNYMWDAERDLRGSLLDPSLVPQNLALDELQRLRESERIFARGRVAVAPIDVPAVRGSGEVDDAAPGTRMPVERDGLAAGDVVAEMDGLLTAAEPPVGRLNSLVISGLALELLERGSNPAAIDALVAAADRAAAEDGAGVREHLLLAMRSLRSTAARAGSAAGGSPTSIASARYLRPDDRPRGATAGAPSKAEPFVFATAKYASGDWDSAPLVPSNLIHSLAQYTEVPLAPEGVTVEQASRDVLQHPFLYLTGHLPVFFSEAEGRNLVDFVSRGGLLFIDDHNHDIDGAFHRSVVTELARLFGAESLQPIPADHELYSTFFEFEDGPPITGHELSGWGDGLIHRELFQVEVDGRIGVLYSNKDYSSEWSYHAENKRFLAVDNTRFGVNILLYALTR